MDLVSIPANPAPEGVVTGTLRARDGVGLRYARWHPPPGRKGTVCLFQGRTEFIEKYFETVRELRARGFAVAMLDWRGQGLSERALSDPRKGARWFDRVVLSAPMIELAGLRGSILSKIGAKIMRYTAMGTAYVPGGSSTVLSTEPYIGNLATSDPVRYARTKAVLEAEPALGVGSPTISWLNAAYRVIDGFADPTYPGKIRQPLMLVAAGRDDVVSTAAIEDFAIRLRAGSHLIVAGSRHELMQEQDRYRVQFWAAFDAFVPGTPLY